MNVIYTYRCAAASHSIEAFFKMGEAPKAIACNDHNSLALRELSRGSWLTFPGSYNSTRK